VIADYPDDTPYPSRLILGLVEGQPIHVVVVNDKERGAAIVITAYLPQPEQWNPDYRTKRAK